VSPQRYQKNHVIWNLALSLIQSTKPLKVPIFLIFLTLSTGLERVFKILIGLRKLTDENSFLSEKELRKYGHDLCSLKNDVIKTCFNKKNIHSEIQNNDLDFIKNKLALWPGSCEK